MMTIKTTINLLQIFKSAIKSRDFRHGLSVSDIYIETTSFYNSILKYIAGVLPLNTKRGKRLKHKCHIFVLLKRN